MKIALQWALLSPTDYIEIDLTTTGPGANRWKNLPKKPEPPATGAALDNTPGWYADLCVQGVQFTSYDHVSVVPIVGGVRVTGWNDDPDEYPVGQRHAQVWEFYDPRPDPRIGGITNTYQMLTVYAENADYRTLWGQQTTTGGPVIARPWSEFVVPATGITIHGIWMTDAQWDAHLAAKRLRGWQEWVV